MTPADVLEGRAQWAVVHGDCLDVLPTLPDKSVAHVITDPPYDPFILQNAKYLGSWGGGCARDFGYESMTPAVRTATSKQIGRLASRWALVFCNVEASHVWRRRMERAGLKYVRTGSWNRLHPAPQFTGDRPGVGFEAVVVMHAKGKRMKWNGGGKPGRWDHAIVNGNARERVGGHSTPKPLPLMLELISDFTDPGDIVLDPFCGSGTTGVACLRLGRRFIGIEKDAKYFQLSIDRLTAESQQQDLGSYRAGQLSMFGSG